MKRIVYLAAIALGIFCCGLVVLTFFKPGVLASKTLHVGGTDVDFEIRNNHGTLYASATERPGGGPSHVIAIGNADELGTSDVEIIAEPERQRVVLRAGRASVEYDLKSKSFRPLPPGA